MGQIAQLVTDGGWTHAEAAEHCCVTQPRIIDLLRGRVARFSIDALVNIATALGRAGQERWLADTAAAEHLLHCSGCWPQSRPAT